MSKRINFNVKNIVKINCIETIQKVGLQVRGLRINRSKHAKKAIVPPIRQFSKRRRRRSHDLKVIRFTDTIDSMSIILLWHYVALCDRSRTVSKPLKRQTEQHKDRYELKVTK